MNGIETHGLPAVVLRTFSRFRDNVRGRENAGFI